MKTFVFTSGDINGIGPEIVFKTLNKSVNEDHRYILVIPENVFDYTAGLVTPIFNYEIVKKENNRGSSQVQVLVQKNTSLNPGEPTKASGKAAFNSIRTAFRLLAEKKAEGVVTAPISKYALGLANINYPGHTEMFADWCKAKNYLMMFLSDKFNAALHTIHVPLKNVNNYIKRKLLSDNLTTAINTLKNDLNIKYPRVAVLGLNPHAGEEGLIGTEESKVITPVVKLLKECDGPFSPDAFFATHLYKKYDLVFGMYHDQVLIPFKMLNFNTGVNYTAGLPIIRTSPDHGTGFDRAYKGIADESSMLEAYRYAKLVSRNRK